MQSGLENFCSIFVLGIKIRKKKIKVKKTLNVVKILKILFSLGYIKGFIVDKEYVDVWFNHKTCSIRSFTRISKKGVRKYVRFKCLPKNVNGLILLSTSKGILTLQQAYNLKVGGEVLFYIC